MQARLHDKYMIVDEKMFLLGGRNSNNLFLGDYTSAQNIDRELFVYETTKNGNSSLYQLRTYFEIIKLPLSISSKLILKKYGHRKTTRPLPARK